MDHGRRSFLRAASGAGALGALAVAAAEATPVPVVPVPPATNVFTSTGYHETEHIRQYYRSARYW
ncbi:MAG: twin-arginine translocation signal domain-containing protein [Massilia sp.]|nr:twin-arginine translocation signal domain-containing protein [Massilia sp.]